MKVFVIDTNVIVLAGTLIRNVPKEQLNCYEKTVKVLHDIEDNEDSILLDESGRVLNEYVKNIYFINDYPNNATIFLEYVYGHSVYMRLTQIGEYMYNGYPDNKQLKEFDPPDRIFIALSYLYKGKAPIIEATDSKWWGIKETLADNGISVIFVDEKYVCQKYKEKMG